MKEKIQPKVATVWANSDPLMSGGVVTFHLRPRPAPAPCSPPTMTPVSQPATAQ